ncbi:sensor histidine kinase [Dyadobacter sp. LHD-138]|uniref:sensor histidine kinase n=1 Tax=Dyadobacter sp. LHD-138 TaxID=3071413 RepID=UPI0027E017F5|nr:sensor histidine kinase [Dyadobacter sp. LHD-138]MDQ6477177.1 sensor histidine kinase [Dyadobacter sp. LHD-138]
MMLGRFTQAQKLRLEERVERIDSLAMYYSNYRLADSEANELYDLLTKKYTGKEYRKIKIRVMLLKAIIYSLNGDHHKSLRISLQALDEAETYKIPDNIYNSCWVIAIMYELAGDLDSCKKYLDKCYEIYREHKLDHVYAIYCIRMSSYYARLNQKDSAVYYAYRGLDYAKKYHNVREERDAYLLLGSALPENRYWESVKYRSLAAREFVEIKDFTSAASQLTNAADLLIKHNHMAEAFVYSDSAFSVLKNTHAYVNPHVYETRGKLLETIGNIDSAYYYFKKFHDTYVGELRKMETAEIKKIDEQYQNDKKEAVIKSKNQQVIFVTSLLAVIGLAVILLARKNRKINLQNAVISKQVEELMRVLEQKQVLLSELQHRVKNNLQHVISILEMQKESVNFNNIDELIRGNQNRIHSIALLHKKLNMSERVNEVDLKKYVLDLSELVKESYDNNRKKISLHVTCEIEKVSIEKALPLGLILVELVSNSMKHAFRKPVGIIDIVLTNENDVRKNKLYYADNGVGFDFNMVSEKGLGMEIIKGLIGQLDATLESSQSNGFELTLCFK